MLPQNAILNVDLYELQRRQLPMGGGFVFADVAEFDDIGNSFVLDAVYRNFTNQPTSGILFPPCTNPTYPSAIMFQIQNAALPENSLIGCIMNPLSENLISTVDFYLPLNQIMIVDIQTAKRMRFKEPTLGAGGTILFRAINEYKVYTN